MALMSSNLVPTMPVCRGWTWNYCQSKSNISCFFDSLHVFPRRFDRFVVQKWFGCANNHLVTRGKRLILLRYRMSVFPVECSSLFVQVSCHICLAFQFAETPKDGGCQQLPICRVFAWQIMLVYRVWNTLIFENQIKSDYFRINRYGTYNWIDGWLYREKVMFLNIWEDSTCSKVR